MKLPNRMILTVEIDYGYTLVSKSNDYCMGLPFSPEVDYYDSIYILDWESNWDTVFSTE